MTLYLTKITLLLAVALLVYKLLLEDTKAHKFKRFYLLTTLILALIIPLISIPVNNHLSIVDTKLQELAEVIIIPNQTTSENNTVPFATIILGIYLFGLAVTSILLIASIIKLNKLKKIGSLIKEGPLTFVLLPKLDSPFTFGKYIYLPISTDLSKDNKIIMHESVHVKQKHTYDILLIEILKTLFWFHPIFYIYKNSIALNHEFLADQGSIKSKKEADEYLQLLLNQTYKQNELNLSSSFNFNLTKKRFIMITKKNNPYKNSLAMAAATALFFTAGIATIQAQEIKDTPPTSSENTEQVYVAVQKRANYPGGMAAFNNEFIAKFITPADVKEDTVAIIVQFIVEADGSIYDAKIIRDPGYGVGEQVIQILKGMPKWIPAEQDGKKVRSQFTLPIKFKIENEQES